MPDRVFEALIERRSIQLREGITESGFVVSKKAGKMMSPTSFYNNHWSPVLSRLKIRYRGPHNMRHTYATFQLRAGIPVHVVSKTLGHSNVTQTWNTYSHLIGGDQDKAAEAINRILGRISDGTGA